MSRDFFFFKKENWIRKQSGYVLLLEKHLILLLYSMADLTLTSLRPASQDFRDNKMPWNFQANLKNSANLKFRRYVGVGTNRAMGSPMGSVGGGLDEGKATQAHPAWTRFWNIS